MADVDTDALFKIFTPIKPNPSHGSYIPDIFLLVINILLYVAGIALIIAILYGGILYITSAGDETKAAKGRASIINGVIGTIIVLLAIVIVSAVRRIFGS